MSANFTYSIKVEEGASILKSGEFSAFKNAKEVLIASNKFPTYEECERAMSGVMTFLSYHEAKSAGRDHVIVSKLNPIIDENANKAEPSTWDKHTILRAYVADAESLKGAKLLYTVQGHIHVDKELLGIQAREVPPSA